MKSEIFLSSPLSEVTWAHLASCPSQKKCSFPWGSAAGAWTCPLTSMYFRSYERMELHLHSSILRGSMMLKQTDKNFLWSCHFY